jgi:hypothetical protein
MQFEPLVIQVCIFCQKNCILIVQGLVVVAGWRNKLFYFFSIFNSFDFYFL